MKPVMMLAGVAPAEEVDETMEDEINLTRDTEKEPAALPLNPRKNEENTTSGNATYIEEKEKQQFSTVAEVNEDNDSSNNDTQPIERDVQSKKVVN